MVCIYCGSPTSVVNSRHQKRSNTIWRRRVCANCSGIFTTTELPDLAAAIMVQDDHRHAKLSPFDRDKLFMSIFESCKHRPSALQDASSLTTTVIRDLLDNKDHPGVLTRHQIVEATCQLLKRFDGTAATVYRAYHPA